MLGLCLPSFAQHVGISNKIPLTDNPLRSHLDSVVHQGAAQYMIHPNAVGLSIGIYKNGTRHTYNYGEVRKGTGLLPGADNFYNLGSVAKTFVTTLLAQAVVEKKASLGTTFASTFPGNIPICLTRGNRYAWSTWPTTPRVCPHRPGLTRRSSGIASPGWTCAARSCFITVTSKTACCPTCTTSGWIRCLAPLTSTTETL